MKFNRLTRTVFVGTLLMGVATLPVSASTQTQTKQLSQPYVVIGSGNSDKAAMLDLLDPNSKAKQLTVTGTDGDQYLNLQGVSDSAMISSVSVAPAEPGSGTLVNIEKYDGANNITKVTSQQYAMAATMAGVNDVIITVSSNQTVSGESALAGVYKALASDGTNLDADNTAAANSLLSATNPAQEEVGADKAGKLSGAVTETASEIASAKQDGNEMSGNEISNALNDNLSNNNINISVSARQPIVTALQNFQTTPIASNKTFIKNAQNQAKNLKQSTGNMMAKANDFLNSEDAANLRASADGWWNKIKNFFTSLFN
ncbi:DUF1002 domain-containing protein [Weissella coleopterorum]|uniref:DUF1002 domain-containing protein n=1 Tax=Weissella coleopterorum TaxID=2714949 RepID=A0A6G8AZF2_9LACO|nr:DUF1002 domain-containing protein [Weissella coleopterorum]QIL50386.1 DUF1002 domain-containing protein [Weissella coleopterorum]